MFSFTSKRIDSLVRAKKALFVAVFTLPLLFSDLAQAKELKDWYAGLQDPPQATLDRYSASKLLDKGFLIRMGLRDAKNYSFNVPGILRRGDEEALGTQVDEVRERLTLASAVRTPFFFESAEDLDYRDLKNFSLRTLEASGKIHYAGHVARITMSHKQPDKVFRFYEKVVKVNESPIYGDNVCQSTSSVAKHGGKQQRTIPYGLWRLALARNAGRIFLVEGESSALTLWYHGYPALAFGGATKWHDNYMSYLRGIKEVYFLMEPDSGGKKLLDCMRKVSIKDHPAYQEFANRVKLVILGPHNDVSDMHVNHFKEMKELHNAEKRESFRAEFEGYLKRAVSLTDPGYHRKDTALGALVYPNRSYNADHRHKALQGRRYTEDVGSGVLTGKEKHPGVVFQKEEIIPSATLQDYSRKKMLPIQELQRVGFADGIFPHARFGPVFGITMSTYDLPRGETDPQAKELAYYRYRISMDSAQPSSSRFPNFLFAPDGELARNQKKIIFGLDNLPLFRGARSVFLVEGESDTLTLRHYGLPALGIPGSEDWQDRWQDLLADISNVYLSVEGDSGGDHLLEMLTHRKSRGKTVGPNLVLINFAKVGKDPSDLHVDIMKKAEVDIDQLYSDPELEPKRRELEETFRARFEETLVSGVYWADLAPYFKKYQAARKTFDQKQTKILAKMEPKLLCRDQKVDCLTKQQIDARYKPWPYVDFYETVTGWRLDHPRSYYDENDQPVEIPLQGGARRK